MKIEKPEILTDKEGFFSKLFSAIPIALSISRVSDGKLVEVNRVWTELMGFSREEALGNDPEELKIIDARQKASFRDAYIKNGSINLIESEIVTKYGEKKVILNSSESITLNGEIFSVNSLIDISDRKNMEASISESELKFRNVFEHSVVGKTLTYPNGKLQSNDAFRKILGYSEEELSHLKWQEMTHPDDVENDQREFDTIITGQKTEAHWEKRYIRKNGSIVWVDISTALQRDMNGNPLYFITTIIDITERKNEIIRRKHAEEEVKELNKTLEERVTERTAQLEAANSDLLNSSQKLLASNIQLEAVNKELESFSYSVSHDLRAPLRHIHGYAEILGRDYSDQLNTQSRNHLTKIIDSTKKMGTLIDDLLSFSRTGRAELNKTLFEMTQVVNDALAQIKPTLTDRNIEFIISPLPSVFGDYNLVRQVWTNLIDNAVKYTQSTENAIISIKSYEENEKTVFSIADNGVGFDMQYAQKLFGVFQRLHSSTEFEGTGIGLANVHRIIIKHGWTTWAVSEVGKGATFYFSVPKISAE